MSTCVSNTQKQPRLHRCAHVRGKGALLDVVALSFAFPVLLVQQQKLRTETLHFGPLAQGVSAPTDAGPGSSFPPQNPWRSTISLERLDLSSKD